MDDRRVEDKLDKIVEKIGNIDITLAKQEASLSEHIRRTEILENMIKPIDRHVVVVNGVIKFLGLLATAIAVISGVLKLAGKL